MDKSILNVQLICFIITTNKQYSVFRFQYPHFFRYMVFDLYCCVYMLKHCDCGTIIYYNLNGEYIKHNIYTYYTADRINAITIMHIIF
jgi:hypothetical protein